MNPYPKNKPFRSNRLREIAKHCTTCMSCSGEYPTVLAHLGGLQDGKGIGQKADDSFFAYLCLDCHTGRDNEPMNRTERDRFDLAAYKKTIKWLFENDYLEVK